VTLALSIPHPHRQWDLIAMSIQLEYDPDELATKITSHLVHGSNSKSYVQ
jgi:hypothetical protein